MDVAGKTWQLSSVLKTGDGTFEHFKSVDQDLKEGLKEDPKHPKRGYCPFAPTHRSRWGRGDSILSGLTHRRWEQKGSTQSQK